MTYEFDRSQDALFVRLFGSLDIKSSPVLEEALEPELDALASLTIDFKMVDYISSMGLRLLLALRKRLTKQGSDMHVINVHGAVKDVFDDTGFTEIFEMD